MNKHTHTWFVFPPLTRRPICSKTKLSGMCSVISHFVEIVQVIS